MTRKTITTDAADAMQSAFSPNQKRAIAKIVMQTTSRPGFVSWLFGPDNAQLRIRIMEAIHGRKMPKSKCGITAMMDCLYRVFPVLDFTCIADRERKLGAFIETAAKSEVSFWEPSLWKGVTTGVCQCCKNGAHVLRNGLCWTCEQENAGKFDINA